MNKINFKSKYLFSLAFLGIYLKYTLHSLGMDLAFAVLCVVAFGWFDWVESHKSKIDLDTKLQAIEDKVSAISHEVKDVRGAAAISRMRG